jgi:hypothetical protein
VRPDIRTTTRYAIARASIPTRIPMSTSNRVLMIEEIGVCGCAALGCGTRARVDGAPYERKVPTLRRI